MSSQQTYRYLDLSGYAFSGKQAVIELVREFQGYHVPSHEFEFLLLRIQGGIRDLETALVDDWSPIRSDAAIRRFRRLIKRLGTKNRWNDPRGWFAAIGWNYDDYFDRRFFELSEQYIAGLIDASWTQYWPFPLAEMNGLDLFASKLLGRVGIGSFIEREIYLAAPQSFLADTRRYLNELLSSNVDAVTTTIVMHNAFEPFYPQRSMRYFEDARCIIVDRDPRDSFVGMQRRQPWAIPAAEFVERHRLMRQIAVRHADNSPRILHVQYEELLVNYDRTLESILAFLGEDPVIHVRPRQYFDPAESIKYMGIWKEYEKQDEIDLIYRELREFCYE